MKLVESFMENNPCYKYNTYAKSKPSSYPSYDKFQKNGPKGLMLHSVGCPQPKASVFIKNWNRSDYNSACVHGFIDGNDGTVYQTLPWNYRAWHCGQHPVKKISANNTHIGVEMCEPAYIKYTGGSNFTCSNLEKAQVSARLTYNSAVELFAMLCDKFNLDPLKDGVIISHAEGYKRGVASNHGDPDHLWRGLKLTYTMDGFRKDVYNKMKGMQPATANETTNETTIKGLVRVFHQGDVINIRNVPDYSAPAVAYAKYNETFEVVSMTADKEFYHLKNGNYITTNPKYTSFIEDREESKMLYYNKIADMPGYAQPVIKKLCDKKFLNGSGTAKDEEGYPADLNLSMDMIRILVINDRAGIYG